MTELYNGLDVSEKDTARAIQVIGSVQEQHGRRRQPATSSTTDRNAEANAAGLREVAASTLASEAVL
jgi:hypothetical protein